MSGRRHALLLSLALVSLGVSCSARGPGPVHVPGDGIRASCKGTLMLGDERVRFRCDLALAPPDRIRVEMRGPVGGTRALLTHGAGRLLVLLPGSREYIEESAAPATVEALLGIRVDARGLFNLVSSADPRRCGEAESEPGLMLTCRDGKLLAEFEGGALELRLEEIERRATIPDDLFAPATPDGWTRLLLDDLAVPAFFLR